MIIIPFFTFSGTLSMMRIFSALRRFLIGISAIHPLPHPLSTAPPHAATATIRWNSSCETIRLEGSVPSVIISISVATVPPPNTGDYSKRELTAALSTAIPSVSATKAGSTSKDTPPTHTAKQTEQLMLLLMKLLKLFPNAKIRGHRDMSEILPKACPCFDAQTEFGNLERR